MVEYILTQIFVSQWSKNEIFSNFNQEFIHKLHSTHTIFMHRTELFFFSNWNFFNIKHAEIRKREKNAQLIGRCFTCDSFGFRWCWFNEPHWYVLHAHTFLRSFWERKSMLMFFQPKNYNICGIHFNPQFSLIVYGLLVRKMSMKKPIWKMKMPAKCGLIDKFKTQWKALHSHDLLFCVVRGEKIELVDCSKNLLKYRNCHKFCWKNRLNSLQTRR